MNCAGVVCESSFVSIILSIKFPSIPKQGTYFKKLEILLESSLNLAESNDKDNTDTQDKYNTHNGTPSAKEKLSMFAYKENNKNGNNTNEETTKEKMKGNQKHENNDEEDMKVDEKKPEIKVEESKEEKVKTNGIKKDEEEKMDTDDNVSSPRQKKQIKGEFNFNMCSYYYYHYH